MTIASTSPSIEYAGAGAATPLAVPFRFFANADLVVTSTVSGSSTLLVLGTDYTVTGANNSDGGTVQPLAPIDIGTKWKIKRVTARTQKTDFVDGNDFPSEAHENGLDRLMAVAQELDVSHSELEGRTIQVPIGEVAPDFASLSGFVNGDLLEFRDGKLSLFDPAPYAGKYYAGGADGRPTPATGTDGGADGTMRADLAQDTGADLVGTSRGPVSDVLDAISAKSVSLLDFIPEAYHPAIAAKTSTYNATDDIHNFRDALKTGAGIGVIPYGKYLVDEVVWDGSGYKVEVAIGTEFQQVAGLTGDQNLHPIWLVTGDNLTLGGAKLIGNIADDEDEYSHALALLSCKNIDIGIIEAKDIRGDAVYSYGRNSSDPEMTMGIHIAGVLFDNVLRCGFASSGGQGSVGFVRRTGSLRCGYRDIDLEPNNSVGNDYQPNNWTFGHCRGAEIQIVSDDPDVINDFSYFASVDLDGTRILNSDPPYASHSGVNAFSLSIDDCRAAGFGDIKIQNYSYSPIRLGRKVGCFSFSSLFFDNVAYGDATYKAVILHLGADEVGSVRGGYIQGALYSPIHYLLRSDESYLNIDIGRIEVTGGLFGVRIKGRVGSMTLDCGGSSEVVFANCVGMQIGKSEITNAASAYAFIACSNLTLFNWTATFSALDYSGSSNITAVCCAINGSTADGINLLLGGSIRNGGIKVLGAQATALPAAATDLASVISLANEMRVRWIDHGFSIAAP